MTDHPFAPEVTQRLDAIGRAELVVGVASFNNARTIRKVVETAAAGLASGSPPGRQG